ncbi:MAG TPA: YraN family protein [Pirellulaceae bacterium]|nr:YraN family protein [Pirellulaceae bacterium]
MGAWGEQAARRHLLCLGYIVIGNNVRSRYGEIDIIAVDRNCIVFVEVKTLCDADQDLPSDRVDLEKQDHLSKAAAEYRRHRRLLNAPGRFDVISVWAHTEPRHRWKLAKLKHYVNAFESTLES